MDFIIDFQGFTDNSNNFIFKECAITSTDYFFIQHWVIAPPYDFYTLSRQKRKDAIWLQLNFHGMKWEDGGIKYDSFLRELKHLCSKANRIFVKGCSKRIWLKNILKSDIIDLDEAHVPRLKDLMQSSFLPVPRCFYHCQDKNHICALNNAFKLKLWLLTNNHVFK